MVFTVIPYLNFLVGYTIIAPIFFAMLQTSVNEVVQVTRGPAA